MEIVWFCIIAFMLAVYVILDGFDLGAGIIHLLIAKTPGERSIILNTIAPVWDGNEVWLLAAGGTLFFAFPTLYASSFSGFYLPLMIVLWLLMLRGAGIELRHQVHSSLWVSFWDVVFSVSSILLAIFFGAALGNVVRGVPLNSDGYFFEPLWTTFTVVPESGILDWFTVILGLVALFTLTSHGANYVALKTSGEIQMRARRAAVRSWWGVLASSILAFLSTWAIRPDIWKNFAEHPWGYLFPLSGILGLLGMYFSALKGRDRTAFLSSSLFIAAMLAATAFGVFPNLLTASTDASYSITVYNAAAAEYGLSVGLVWWMFGIALAIGYFVYLYRSFRGKVADAPGDAGY
ncbi:MAG: cytochrome d ubiquinol oxidase subunit II [Ignavibacteriae bacterium]|nr:cytochrome d ubiquinol oxidase subunit II [Ignavibacteria bacterium]MBI3364990.1 cytochrome d ubiquinol oxidase subunit II [Ignavibacteriota bacterium]